MTAEGAIPRSAVRWASPVIVVVWALGLGACVVDAVFHSEQDLRHRDTLTTARLAMAFQVAAWCLMILRLEGSVSRLLWTLGAMTLVVHIVVALWLAHGWSHDAAVERVREVGGFGGGIVVSYLFVLVWLADDAWWWASPAGRSVRPRWFGWLIHGFLGFVAFNATEVYVADEMRLVYALAFGLPLAGCCAWRLARSRDRSANT